MPSENSKDKSFLDYCEEVIQEDREFLEAIGRL
jgi:hypothetical protein